MDGSIREARAAPRGRLQTSVPVTASYNHVSDKRREPSGRGFPCPVPRHLRSAEAGNKQSHRAPLTGGLARGPLSPGGTGPADARVGTWGGRPRVSRWGQGRGHRGRLHGRAAGACAPSALWAYCYLPVLVPSVVILGTAAQADLFLIHYHLWPSRAGPQTRRFAPNAGITLISYRGSHAKY